MNYFQIILDYSEYKYLNNEHDNKLSRDFQVIS